MAKIRSAYLDYPQLTVNLDNGQDIFIPLGGNLRLTNALSRDSEYKPRTDGACVYWRDGPRLSFEDIMGIVEGGSGL